MDWQTIDAYYHQHRAAYPDPFRLRIHRAISWLKAAAEAGRPAERPSENGEGLDFRFTALWIAFNAAYAKEIDGRTLSAERSDFRQFLQTVCGLDKERLLYQLVWQTYSGSIRTLLDNRYTFQPFWDFHNGKIGEAAWQDAFAGAKKKAHAALAAQDTDSVLAVLFDRLYTLRNQIVHGGATFAGSANRSQLKDACNILSSLIPAVLHIMQQHPQRDWGRPFYPFVKED
ncbi:HEPN domain-containing protein [Neisseria bacilliformis]|uniref:HEPN domain-containing protein n=1 Tax=Neisseria bacilliformis TaxID=267212 RepID=UPI0028E5E492|nr:HEPN domain-containing protein [Neisseria bacilliformis]